MKAETDTSIGQDLLRAMELAAACDRTIKDEEIAKIRELKQRWPILRECGEPPLIYQVAAEHYPDADAVREVAILCAGMPRWFDVTAYKLAYEVVIADGEVHEEERRFLDAVRTAFSLAPHVAASIEGAGRPLQ
jgi:hypothetical protein